MSHLESNELIRAEEFIEKGQLEGALQLLKVFKTKKDLSLNEQISYYVLKSSIADYHHKISNYLKYVENAYQLSQDLNDNVLLFDVYIKKAQAYIWDYKFEQALDLMRKCENFFTSLNQEAKMKRTKREADIADLKKLLYYMKEENFDEALRYAEYALVLRKNLDHKADIFKSLRSISSIHSSRGDLNQALNYAKQCLTLAKEIDDIIGIQISYVLLGITYVDKGELAQGIDFQKQALSIAEEINDDYGIAACLNNLGIAYREMGDFEQAQKSLEQSLKIFQKVGSPGFSSLDNLLDLTFDKGDLKLAQKYLENLKQIKNQYKTKKIKDLYRVNKARFLKTSSRALNRGKAEEMLKELVEEEDIDYYITITALLNLCELLLGELRNTGNLEIIEELNTYTKKLLLISEKTHSYLVLAETNLLLSKLALLTFDLKYARKLLTDAQKIAEVYGLKRLAMKISYEHDQLLKQLTIWENFKASKASIKERLDLSRLNEQIENMVHNRVVDVPEISNEEPVAILIIDEGGNPIFSQSFLKEWSFEDHLFGGFLSAINSFSHEMFSEGLDRANFGKYTILMIADPPFLICYLFKGQSYLAQQRIRFFCEKIKKDKNIWITFNKFRQTNRLVQLKDIPTINPLITDIFINHSTDIFINHSTN